MLLLHEMTANFSRRWGPHTEPRWTEFLNELRALLEAYGQAALMHESLPDVEHKHGDPV